MRQKIIDLFQYRELPKLMELGKVENQKSLLKQLIDLQFAIYYLDAYLEANWKVSKTKLNAYWKDIHKALLNCGVEKSKLAEYSKHILRYQKHELGLRENKLQLHGSMEYFYYYKSCDVRLMRQIIYDQSVGLNSIFKLADWRYFDLITEVNDDVEDVFEDLSTINGNLVLISAWKEGKSACLKRFSSFILDIEKKNKLRRKQRKNQSNYDSIYKMTLEQINNTNSLLTKNLNKLKTKQIADAKLFQHLV